MNPEQDGLTEIEEEALRGSIRRAINNPMEELLLMYDYTQGEHISPDEAVVVDRLTMEKAERFYELVREELEQARAEGNVEFSRDLEEALNPDSKGQNTFDHELSHVQSAEGLGVSLEDSKIELFFTTSGFGQRLVHQFIPPEDTDLVKMVQIALAPEQPSPPDFAVVKKALTQSPDSFAPDSDNYRIVSDTFRQKTGREISSLLQE
jgi:hypothetical protein